MKCVITVLTFEFYRILMIRINWTTLLSFFQANSYLHSFFSSKKLKRYNTHTVLSRSFINFWLNITKKWDFLLFEEIQRQIVHICTVSTHYAYFISCRYYGRLNLLNTFTAASEVIEHENWIFEYFVTYETAEGVKCMLHDFVFFLMTNWAIIREWYISNVSNLMKLIMIWIFIFRKWIFL